MSCLDSELYQEIRKCARCGYCREKDENEICPVRSIIGFESSYARGKLHLARLCLEENTLHITPKIIKKFYLCALCGNCFKHCPLSINTPRIINELRHRFLQDYNPLHDPNIIKNLVSNLCHNPTIINDFIAKKGNIGPRLYQLKKNNEEYLFFSGCMSESNKKSLESILKIFNYLDFKVNELKQQAGCCGMPLLEFGNKDFLLSKLSVNMNVFKKIGTKKIIVNCPGCLYAFKEFYNTEPGILDFIHLTEFLNDNLGTFDMKKGIQATYHDPCLLGRYLGNYEAPRQLLLKMGFALKEMPRSKDESFCCGGGTLSIMYPDISREISKSRVKEAKITGSSLLLTSCPLCKRNLAGAGEVGIEIMEITDLLAGMLRRGETRTGFPVVMNPEIKIKQIEERSVKNVIIG